jgi:hypothetical protein
MWYRLLGLVLVSHLVTCDEGMLQEQNGKSKPEVLAEISEEDEPEVEKDEPTIQEIEEPLPKVREVISNVKNVETNFNAGRSMGNAGPLAEFN